MTRTWAFVSLLRCKLTNALLRVRTDQTRENLFWGERKDWGAAKPSSSPSGPRVEWGSGSWSALWEVANNKLKG